MSGKKLNWGSTFRLAVVGFSALLLVATILTGCTPTTLQYDGVQRSEFEVEEILADKLEVENPGLDLEVNISTAND
jgi:hypothetical protein